MKYKDKNAIQMFLQDNGFGKPLLAGLSGMIAIIFHIVFTDIMKRLGLLYWNFSQIGSAVMTNSQVISGWQVYITGTIQNLILSGLFGVVFYYSLIVLGKDHIHLKGIAFSVVTWMFTRSVYLTAFNFPKQVYAKAQYVLIYYFGIIVWGFLTAFLINKLIFAKQNKRVPEDRSVASWKLVPQPVRKQEVTEKMTRAVKPKKI